MNFDIDRYIGSVAALDDSDIDYDDFRRQPLPDDALRCLRYMHDVEHHTVCYLRDLLVTRAHDDPVITSFLTMWAYEEFWHGEAIGKVLRAHDEIAGRPRIDAARERVGSGRLGTLGTMFASVLTEHIVTVSLTWGAVNEWTTQAAYVRLAQRTGHPTLTELVRRIAKQEGRHIDFYASEATRRLENRRAQRMTRWALTRFWTPVGSGVMPHGRDRASHHVPVRRRRGRRDGAPDRPSDRPPPGPLRAGPDRSAPGATTPTTGSPADDAAHVGIGTTRAEDVQSAA